MRARTLLAAAALVLLAGVSAHADRETAKFQAGRGDKALAAKKWDEAEAFYRKALEEDDTFALARWGIAQSLIGAGKSAAALEDLRAFVDAAKAAGAPAEWKALQAKAERQLLEIDAAGAALQKITDDYVEGLVLLGERYAAKDPGVAERALRRALKLKPGHARAVATLQKMGKSAASETITLFDGQTLNGWDGANPPRWQVIDGALVGFVKDAGLGARSLQIFEGNFDVRVEMKVLEEYPGPRLASLAPCWTSATNYYQLGVLTNKLMFWDTTSEDQDREIANVLPSNLKKPFDLTDWTAFELRFRAKEVTALVNGEVIATDERPAHRQGGFVGLRVQNCKVAFRNVQVDRR